MKRLAIIGSGIAGLGCAHFLQRDYEVTLFEKNDYVGGHTNTVEAEEADRLIPIDTGFMVFNKQTYPLLTHFFETLEVKIKPAPMSFSVKHTDRNIEFCGSSINHLFAQRRNLLRPSFYRLIAAINRFNKEATEFVNNPQVYDITLNEFVTKRGYGKDFFDLYLVPMSSAVWSTPPELMLEFPAGTLLRFFYNHGFLGLNTQHPWFTVEGGSKTYIKKILNNSNINVRLNTKIKSIHRGATEIKIISETGDVFYCDNVILASHADQALKMIADPLPEETRLLSEFKYQTNQATLHNDESVMPKTRLAWSSWNYEIARVSQKNQSTAIHYWMNSLQGVSNKKNYFVSINRPEAIDPVKVIKRIQYEHPLFSVGAINAQKQLPELNTSALTTSKTFFAGSYFKYGFHEDAFGSAVALSQLLLKKKI